MRTAEFFEQRFRDFTYKPELFECERTRHEDGIGYTLAFIQNKLPDLRGLDYTQKMLKVHNHKECIEMGYVITYDSPKDISLFEYTKAYKTKGKNIYAKKTWLACIKLEDGKLRKRCANNTLIKVLLEYLRLECLLYENLPEKYKSNFESVIDIATNSSTILKGLIYGNLTNPRDVVKRYLATSYQLTGNYNLDSVLKYTKEFHCHNAPTLKNLIEFTTSFEKSVEQYIKHWTVRDWQWMDTFKDMLWQAQALDRKINPQWSDIRMELEHSKMTKELMVLNEEALSDAPLCPEMDIKDAELKGGVLNTERKVYTEAKEMNHCLYTNYYQKMTQKKYLALSIVVPERCTVGLRFAAKENTLQIEQVHTLSNGNVSDSTREIIDRYVYGHIKELNALQGIKSDKEADYATITNHIDIRNQRPEFDNDDLPY